MNRFVLVLAWCALACGSDAPTETVSTAPATSPASTPSPEPDPVPAEEPPPPPLLDAKTLGPLEEGVVLHMTKTDPLGGSLSELIFRSDGTASWWSERLQDDTTAAPTASFELTENQLPSLAGGLKKNGTCALKSTATHAIPDDGITTIRVRLEGVSCDVLLWNSETSSKSARTTLNMIQAQIPR